MFAGIDALDLGIVLLVVIGVVVAVVALLGGGDDLSANGGSHYVTVVIDGDADAKLDVVFVAGGKVKGLYFGTDGGSEILDDLFGLTVLGGECHSIRRPPTSSCR